MASKDRAVGYKRPPKNRRFKKRQSGNPHGRPKGSGDFASIMDDVLNEKVRLKINERWVVVTGRHALGLLMVDRAVRGDVRMVQLLQKYGCFERSNEPKIKWILESARNV